MFIPDTDLFVGVIIETEEALLYMMMTMCNSILIAGVVFHETLNESSEQYAI